MTFTPISCPSECGTLLGNTAMLSKSENIYVMSLNTKTAAAKLQTHNLVKMPVLPFRNAPQYSVQ